MSGSHLSRDFFELIKNIGESRSKQEEDRIILSEMRTLKDKMKEKNVSNAKMKELCIRMIYVEMLGHDAAFGYINAINLSCMKNLIHKRVGYLACCLCLNKDHQLMLLLISTIQKDLSSDNFLEVSMALTVVCRLISSETIPVIMPLVVKLLSHSNPNVRKKAIGAMNRFLELSPSVVESSIPRCKKMLYDKDPAVMGASLIIIENLVSKEPQKHKELTKTLVSILKQVTEHCLSRDYDYHRIPAPWIQLKLLRILGYLGDGDKDASDSIYPILKDVMKRADIGINVGFAIVYECVRTAISIYPNPSLLNEAANSISRFLSSDSHNLKYLGINALAKIVQIDAKHAVKHQLTVIDCLEDPDDTLRRKTLDLLYSMTNPQNVRVIMQKLMTFMQTAVDPFLRSELVSRITQIAEKFAPDNAWYIQTMNSVFELGGDLVRSEMVDNLINLIASEDIDSNDPENIRIYAVDTYVELLSKPRIPDVLLKVIGWVLGEYGYLSKKHSNEAILLSLCDAMEQLAVDSTVRLWLLNATVKLCAHMDGKVPDELVRLVKRYQQSVYVSLQQKAHEFFELLENKNTARAVLPRDKFGSEEKVDVYLGFLQNYVDAALRAGAPEYKPRTLSDAPTVNSERKKKSALQFQAYPRDNRTQSPTTPVDPFPSAPANPTPSATYPTPSTSTSAPAPSASFGGGGGNNAAGFFASAGPWGAEGFNSDPKPKSEPAADTAESPYPTSAPVPEVTAPSQPKPRAKPTTTNNAPVDARRQQANLLFQGLGQQATANRGAGVSPPKPPVVPEPTRPAPPATAPPVKSQNNLLFEVDSSDLPPQAPAGGAGVDLFSIFDEPDEKALGGFAAGAAPKAETKGNGGLDIFGGGGGGEVSYPKGSEAMSPALKKQLSSFSKGEEKVEYQGSDMHISYQKVYLPGQTMTTIFITNGSQSPLEATSSLQIPQGLFLRCDADPKARLQSKQDLSTQTMTHPQVQGHSTIVLMVGVFCRNSSSLAGCSLKVHVRMGHKTQPITIPITTKDIIRPQVMSVQQYGVTWKKLGTANECKELLGSSKISSASAFGALADQHQMKLIKIIGSECIVAAKLVTGTKMIAPVLLHAKVKTGGAIIFMVRSTSRAISSAVLSDIKAACT